jgi:hypothetical protein
MSTSGTSTGSANTTDSNYGIGYRRASSTQYFNGKIDQFRIFNKVLSQQEVTTLSIETHAYTTISTTDIFDDNSGVALYQLDGNANDTGGVSGKFGSAAIFNGSSSAISTPITANYSNLSISCWVKFNALPTGGADATLVSKGFYVSGSNTQYLQLRYEDFTDQFTFAIRQNNTYNQQATSGVTASVGVWYNVVGTLDSSGNAQIYVNGSAGTSTASAPTMTNSDNFEIGSFANTVALLNGKLDDVRIYSDVLTSTEVGYIYNNTNASIPTDNLEAHYKLDGDARDEQQLYDGTATNVTYAYDGTATNVTYQEATNFSPDLIWIKNRDSSSYPHVLTDSVRGNTKYLQSDSSSQELTTTGGITSFDNNGFSLGNDGYFNGGASGANNKMVAWCFNAGEGAAATNNDGTIASTVKANQDAGFSIVKYTGNGTAGATIGHGLTSLTPSLIIWKNLDATSNWLVYSPLIGSDSEWLYLNLTSSKQDSGNTNEYPTNKVNPTSSVVTVNGSGSSNNINISGQDTIMYCFADIAGYQKIGSYDGTGASGNMVETGFESAFILFKRTDSGDRWLMADNKRADALTNMDDFLDAQDSAQEGTFGATNGINFLSNGFSISTTDGVLNGNGGTYIYLAIAADPDTTTPTVENSFDVVTYTGNGGTQEIATDFKPDLVWIKGRDTSGKWNVLYDSIRGATKMISSNQADAEATYGSVTMDSNSFTLGSGFGDGNTNNENYVAWCWKAGDHDDSLPQINTEGSIDSVVSVNAEAGFSIVKWSADGSSNGQVGHGLSATPELVITKSLSSSGWWTLTTAIDGSLDYLRLDTTAAKVNTSGLTISSTTITNWGYASEDVIAYCFHSVTGYQKVGKYTGTGVSGLEVSLSFSPRFLLVKGVGATGWILIDSQRGSKELYANLSDAEDASATAFVLGTNKFTVNSTGTWHNSYDVDYIYLAIK